MRIVRCLRSYHKAIPVGFLAQEIGYTTPVVRRYLTRLQEKGIVNLHDDNVSVVMPMKL